jgi:hypothetical protein
MAFLPFWDECISEELLEVTDGSLVEYRGAQFHMHFEFPTVEALMSFNTEVRGVARILIGPRSRFPAEPELGTLITVDGDDWVIGAWQNSDDGEVIFIALTQATRTL